MYIFCCIDPYLARPGTFFTFPNYSSGHPEGKRHNSMSPGKVKNVCHAVLTLIWQDLELFSLFPTTLVATRKGKDTFLCHLERLKMLAMLYWPISGKTLTFFTLPNYSGGHLEGERYNSMSPGKVKNACHAVLTNIWQDINFFHSSQLFRWPPGRGKIQFYVTWKG